MNSEQLSQHVADFVGAACARVTGTGSAQYEKDGEQKFESMSLDELIDWANEELQDVAVYAVMTSLRMESIRDLISSKVSRLSSQVHDIERGLAAVRDDPQVNPDHPSLTLIKNDS